MDKKKIAIIGAGVVGSAVGIILKDHGYPIVGVASRSPASAERLANRLHTTAYLSYARAAKLADLVFVTTTDSAIVTVVEEVAAVQAFHPGQIVVHMSGALSSAVLAPAARLGAIVLSIHPLQSFASVEQAIQNLPGSIFSIEGDPQGFTTAEELVRNLGGEFFFIDQRTKPLYHAGACVVSNYLVTLVDLGARLLESAGLPRQSAIKALLPLLEGTLRNIRNIGIPQALTGPIARGDVGTIRKHLSIMQEVEPELVDLYQRLGYHTAEVAGRKGTINREQIEELQTILSNTFTIKE